MPIMTPKQVLTRVQKALAETLQATESLIADITTMPDSPIKEYLMKKAQALKGDIIKAAAKEEPKIYEH